ncbi:CBS domain-containing protein [Siculibacillus lacustris]|uniref:CBS domain-containing protein n=1 Tax=Siculibacillus lacustris TaxID=1549641 RepID=A0A4Q9VU77_9HYPH|nr:CBS domain-containing protein [Siculibacillus lacustris]TBW39718.1 CBS domain-containing protein [Siculibacillus lacustris]
MLARDIMTRSVVSVGPKVTLAEVARALLDARVSAVPVIDGAGRPIGVVSEWDLIGQHAPERLARRDRWLASLAQGQSLSTEFLETTRPNARTAEEVMNKPVISISEEADLAEIARVLTEHKVKRLFVVRDGRLVGVVSRADLARALSEAEDEHHPARAPVEEIVEPPVAPPPPPPPVLADGVDLSADAFRHLVELHEESDMAVRAEQQRARERATRDLVRRLADEHLSESEWNLMVERAKAAAERGEKDFLLLRFPAKLCSDGGRMINVPDPDWPTSLRGKAADVYERWLAQMKPRGFGLSARILEFPGGFPGDVGMTLTWGG